MSLVNSHNISENKAKEIKKYVQRIVCQNGGDTKVVEPWKILDNLSEFKPIAQYLANFIKESDINGLIALADSGLPLAIMVSYEAQLPIYFYRRKKWKIDGFVDEFAFFPRTNKKLNVSLVDSHIFTGFTVHSCDGYTQCDPLEIKNLLVPISFFNITPSGIRKYRNSLVPYMSIINAEEIEHDLLELMHIENLEQLFYWRKEHNKESFSTQNVLKLNNGNEKFCSNGQEDELKAVNLLDIHFAEWLQKQYNCKYKEHELWEFLSTPFIINRISEIVGKFIGLNDYDCIMCFEAIGTIYGIRIAYQNNYKGKIISTNFSDGWEEQKSPKKTLFVIGNFSLYSIIADVIDVASSLHYEILDILTICMDKEKDLNNTSNQVINNLRKYNIFSIY